MANNSNGYGLCAYGWRTGAWSTLDELRWAQEAVQDVAKIMGGQTKFKSLYKNKTIWITHDYSGVPRSWAPPGPLSWIYGDINLIGQQTNELYMKHTIAHELGHVWDERNGWKLSDGMRDLLGTMVCSSGYSNQSDCRFDVTAGKEPPVGIKASKTDTPYPNQYWNYPLPLNTEGPWEDWADSFAVYVSDAYYLSQNYNVLGPMRRKYINDQIHK